MTKYYREDTMYRPRIIRDRGKDYMLERYDRAAKKWVTDVEMLQIYTGDIPVDVISEEEAMDEIR